MLKLNVKGIEYKLKFGYKSLKNTNILKEVIQMQKKLRDIKGADKESEESETKKEKEITEIENMEIMEEILGICSKLVLAALQKYHKEFRADYKNPKSVQECIEKTDDFIDDYMDEEDSMPIMELFNALAEELFNDGFLSKKQETKAETEALEMKSEQPETETQTSEN